MECELINLYFFIIHGVLFGFGIYIICLKSTLSMTDLEADMYKNWHQNEKDFGDKILKKLNKLKREQRNR